MLKNILLLFIFLNLSFSGVSQSTYIKTLKEDTTTWQHYGVTYGVEQKQASSAFPVVDQNSYAAIDTISFSGYKYKKFYYLGYGSQINYTSKTLVGFLREDTIARKVYYRATSTSSDQLLYDFSKNVNDSIYLGFQNCTFQSGYYRLDSIIVKNIASGSRKHYYYRKHMGNTNPSNQYYEIIEGIGCTYHMAYIFGCTPSQWIFQTSGTCKPKWTFGLNCKHDDLKKMYQNCIMTNTTSSFFVFFNDSCSFGYFVPGGLKTNDWDKIVRIGPNPSDNGFNLSISQSFENINISITDLTGKIVMELPKNNILQDGNSVHVSTKNLAQGVYIIQVNLNGTLIKRPIVVQH